MNSGDRLRQLVEGLEACDRRTCFALQQQWLAENISTSELYNGILLPALAHMGARWEHNTLSIIDEHIATEIIRQMVSMHAFALQHPSSSKGLAMVGCVPNEYHDVPGLMFANLLEEDGWDVLFFGQSTPQEDIIAKVTEAKPALLCLIMKTAPRLDEAMSLLRDIRAAAPGMKIILGGVNAPSLRAVLTPLVDAFADCPVSGVETAMKLTNTHTPS